MLAFSCWLRWVCVVFFFFKCLSCERITNLTVKWETNVISINCRKNIVVVDVELHTATTTHSSVERQKTVFMNELFFREFQTANNFSGSAAAGFQRFIEEDMGWRSMSAHYGAVECSSDGSRQLANSALWVLIMKREESLRCENKLFEPQWVILF